MTDPKRILEVRRHLYLGAHVMYFDHRCGALAPGRVLQLLPTQATVRDDITRTQWKLPYAAIVADSTQGGEPAAPPLRPRAPDLPRFKLGDNVVFTDKHLRERVGTIVRMNTKTYSLLYDGEQCNDHNLDTCKHSELEFRASLQRWGSVGFSCVLLYVQIRIRLSSSLAIAV